AGHEPVIGEVVHPRGRIDPDDPQLPELRLLLAAIAVAVPPGALDSFLGGLEQLAPAAAGALGEGHDLLLPLVARNVALYAWHVLNLQQPANAPVSMGHHGGLTQLPLPLLGL